MTQFLENIGLLQKEGSSKVKMGPTIVLIMLMLGFVGATFYILISSLS